MFIVVMYVCCNIIVIYVVSRVRVIICFVVVIDIDEYVKDFKFIG